MDVHAGAVGDRQLGRQMGRAPEAVDAEPASRRQIGLEQGPVSDDAGAQQRRRLSVVEHVGQGVGVPFLDGGVGGVAAVDVPPGEAGGQAQVFPTGEAEAALPAGMAEPGDADPLAGGKAARSWTDPVDHADDLVAGDHPGPLGPKITLGQVEVGAAHAAHPDPHPDLTRPGLGTGSSIRRSGRSAIGPGRSTAHAGMVPASATERIRPRRHRPAGGRRAGGERPRSGRPHLMDSPIAPGPGSSPARDGRCRPRSPTTVPNVAGGMVKSIAS